MLAHDQDARKALDARMRAAHSRADLDGLVAMYTQAADMSGAASDVDAECFYLTQAYVFALDSGVSASQTLHARLKTHGREA